MKKEITKFILPGSMWFSSHEVNLGYWRAWQHDQCLQGVLITLYWLLITSIDFTYFLTFRKKNLKIIQNKKLIEPLKGLFGVHDGWKRLHQDEHWQGGGQCYPSSWACHVQGYQVMVTAMTIDNILGIAICNHLS